MSFADKIGRWFVVASWILAGIYCLLSVIVTVSLARELHAPRMIVAGDVIYAVCGIAFLVAAVGVARRSPWARILSVCLWALFGYWDFGAIGAYGDKRWLPLAGFGMLVIALFWLIAPAPADSPREALRNT
jgi:hypothetical protein